MNFLTRQVAQTRQPVLILQRGLKKAKIPVTLLKDIPRVGSAGTVVHVDKAHMRYQLYPKRLAEYVVVRQGPLDRSKIVEEPVTGSPSKAQADEQQKVHSLALRNQEIIQRIVGLEPLVFERSVVPSESNAEQELQAIYGSLTKADVLKTLAEDHGISIDKDALSMDDKIKAIGEYICIVKLIYAGQASFKVKVVPAQSNDAGGPRASKTNRWNAGPPQLSRTAKSQPASDNSTARSAPSNATAAAAAGGSSSNNNRGLNSSATTAGNNGAGPSLSSRTKPQEKSSSSAELIEGEQPEQVEEMNRRLLFLISYLVGSEVKVTTKSGEVFLGILDSVNPNDAQSVVLRYAYVQDAGKAVPPIDTLVVRGEDCLLISGAASFDDGEVKDSSRTGFKTDTDISRTANASTERELHRWVPDTSDIPDPLESGLEHIAASGQSWDQFATNERLFGLTTDFDEEIYTTKLDRTRADFKDREREAIRIAQEIQNAPYLNAHVAEERHELLGDSNDDGSMDEEDRYGAVLRPAGAPGKYVPPYLRGKSDNVSQSKPELPEDALSIEPPRRSSATPAGSAQSEGASSAQNPAAPEAQPNNAAAAAALAKLNIRMGVHSPAAKTVSIPDASTSVSASPNPAADPAITAAVPAPKPTAAVLNIPGNSKLANLRGLGKHRTDVAAMSKPMADITEKLSMERERMQQQKQALLINRMDELKKFHKSFKLSTPMPDDVAEITGVKKKGIQRSDSSTSVASDRSASPASSASTTTDKHTAATATSANPSDKSAKKDMAKADSASAARPSAAASAAATTTVAKEAEPKTEAANAKKETPRAAAAISADKDGSAGKKTETGAPGAGSADSKKTDKKPGFKFNAKASSFKPNASAPTFVPKISASSSRTSSAAGTREYNPFFGHRRLNKSPQPLWNGAFKLPSASAANSDASPTWQFGSRSYRSQFVPDEPEAMVYAPQGYGMPQYGYGYYAPYQYPPQMPPMMPPGAPPSRMPTSSPFAQSPYGGGAAPAYATGPYTSAPGYPSPMLVAAGRSPIIPAVNGPAPPTVHPLPHVQANGSGTSSGNMPIATTPEMGPAVLPTQPMQSQHLARSGSDSPSVMYGTPPVPMGMVPPPMPFNGMQSGYMGHHPPPPPPQGYPPQSMAVPMGYHHPQYPPHTQPPYGASPPGMHVMPAPHADPGTPGSSHPPGY
ncbi:poly(A)-binding protein binding protein [Dipsacomyces acuminosporus]|nr:poly(A)-binding protein binding protein [Dipsacomyces acuminosporus]